MDDDAFRQAQRSDTNVYAFRRLKWRMPVQSAGGNGAPFWGAAIIVAVLGFGAVYVATSPEVGNSIAQATLGQFGLAGCDIKGNVSIGSGERIYHMPGQRHYAETVIRSEYGERWFCSEQDAREAGWRKSGV